MKRLLILLTTILLMMVNINIINASGDVYVNTSSVSVVRGSSTTIRITADNCAGKIRVSSQNSSIARVNVSEQWVDNDSINVKITGVSNGTTNIVIEKVDITTYDLETRNGSIVVKVNVYTPVSGDASLASLKVGDLPIETVDDKNFVVYAGKDIEGLTIVATPSSSKASVSEIDQTLVEGWNEKPFTITAENEDTNTFNLKIYVEETPTIYFNETLGVVKNLDKLQRLVGFEEQVIQINDEDVTIFNHNNLNLIYLEDEGSEKDYYIYMRDTNSIMSRYTPITVQDKKYIVIDVNYEDYAEYDELFNQCKVDIDSQECDGFSFKAINMNNYRLVVLMNDSGIVNVYCYDTIERTLQKYVIPNNPDNSQLYMTITIASLAAGLISLIISIINVNKKKKN